MDKDKIKMWLAVFSVIMLLALMSSLSNADIVNEELLACFSFDKGSVSTIEANSTYPLFSAGNLGNNWILNQTGMINWSVERANTGALFNWNNGNDAWIVNRTELTWSFWIYYNAVTESGIIARNRATYLDSYMMWADNNNNNDNLWMGLGNGCSDQGSNYAQSDYTLSIDQWINVIVIYNGSASTNAERLKFYFDGNIDGLVSYVGTIPSYIQNCSESFGVSNGTNIGKTSGRIAPDASIDEFMIIDRAITGAEVTQLYEGMLIPNISCSQGFILAIPPITLILDVNITYPANNSILLNMSLANVTYDVNDYSNCSHFIDDIYFSNSSNVINSYFIANLSGVDNHKVSVYCVSLADNSNATDMIYVRNVPIVPSALTMGVCPSTLISVALLSLIFLLSFGITYLGFRFKLGLMGVLGGLLMIVAGLFFFPCSDIVAILLFIVGIVTGLVSAFTMKLV